MRKKKSLSITAKIKSREMLYYLAACCECEIMVRSDDANYHSIYRYSQLYQEAAKCWRYMKAAQALKPVDPDLAAALKVLCLESYERFSADIEAGRQPQELEHHDHLQAM